MSESPKQWPNSGVKKDCFSCFFKNFAFDDPKVPCPSCSNYDKYVTDSEIFWKDKEPVKDTYRPGSVIPCTKEEAQWPYPEETPKALDRQVAGDHYKKLKIQPVEYCHVNKLGYCESNIVKYITRWKDKGGKADLEKVKHYVDLLIQLEGL